MHSIPAPHDDVVIPCQVRLWESRSVHVFVHPREWAKVSLQGGVPMRVRCHGVEFACKIMNVGEFYRMGSPQNPEESPIVNCKSSIVNPLGLPGHGDYDAEAWIDWDEAVPELVADGLTRDPKLGVRWRSLTLAEVRRRLNEVLRARKPSVHAERSLKLLADLNA